MKHVMYQIVGVLSAVFLLALPSQAQANADTILEDAVYGAAEAVLSVERSAIQLDIDYTADAIRGGYIIINNAGVAPERIHFLAEQIQGAWVVHLQEDVGYQTLAGRVPTDALPATPPSAAPDVNDTIVPNAQTGTIVRYVNMDTFVTPSSTWTGNGTRRTMGIGTYRTSTYTWSSSRALIRFDSYNLPAGAYATEAYLEVGHYGSGYCNPGEFYIARVTSGWGETTVWPGPNYTGNYGRTTFPCYNSSSSPQLRRVNISNLALIDQIEGGNSGIMLRHTNESANGVVICSGNLDPFCTASFRPRIVIKWRVDDPGTPTITSPSNNATISDDSTVNFTLSPGSTNGRGTRVLHLQVARDSGFNNRVFNDTTTGTTFNLNLSDDTYYARARQGDSLGLWSNWTSTIQFNVNVTADVAISGHTASPSPALPGQNLTYNLTLANNGAGTATGVQVVNTLPAGVSYVSASGGTCSHSSGTVTCGIADISNGATRNLSITVNIPAGQSTDLSNQATISTAKTDPNSGNNSSTLTTPIETRSDPGLTMVSVPSTVDAGSSVMYEMTVSSNGPLDATGITATLNLPVTVTYTGNDSGCTHSSGTVTCNIGTLTTGNTQVIAVTGDMARNATGIQTASASVSAAEPDIDVSNNDATADTTITAISDVSVTGSASAASIQENQTLTYTWTVTNNGPSDSGAITLTANLDTDLTYVSDDTGCTHSSGTVTCALSGLATGVTTSVQVETTVNQGAVGDLTTDAQVTVSGTIDDMTGNNSASVVTPVTTSVIRMADATLNLSATTTLLVEIECLADSCDAVQADMQFDPAVLQVEDIRPGSFPGSTGNTVNIIKTSVDNTAGLVELDYYTLNNGNPPVTGTGTLFEVDVRAPAVGTSPFTLDMMVASLSGDPVTVQFDDAQITVEGCACSEDVNGDGIVSPTDVMYAINRLSGSDLSADVDGDSDVDMDDVSLIQNALGN